ncbi:MULTISPECIES: MmgE/PrpD family protein [Haloferax]|uniref:MmgE/PrpD family protein n=2 Tax=Haloferax TaxID=2251 RepID=A0A6G1Z638_9EURY|nr:MULTISPECIES: MmgE/PrpD family protein [Haloferax]KAB1185450.1 MmgE/PrpD family protein [Haloferax sp. CBA1149]MRW82097.1 MmgE/PrpD family protein [Haloferax marinisediminis]
MSSPPRVHAEQPERTLAAFVADLTFDDVPPDAVETIERAFVDTVGVTLAGVRADAGVRAASVATSLTPTADGVSVLGTGETASLTDATLANGTAGHALDFDDLSWAMDGHPSVPLVAPILALAEHLDSSGEDVITAFAAGFETECYVAEPVSPTHYERGWHPTATFGTFGATAAAATLLDLDVGETQVALGIAASMPSGLKRNFGTMTKPLHAGLAGRSGITAALLAAEGFTAEETAISGPRGFWDLYADGAERRADPPGDPWRLVETGISIKAYPCCYFTHTSIAAVETLVEAHSISHEDIDRIEVVTSRGAGDALVYPEPKSGLEGKFSMEYAVACAATRDRVDLDAFTDDALDDAAVQRVRALVSFEVDESLPYKSNRTNVRLTTTDGTTVEETQSIPPGTPETPLSEAELRAKFVDCATRSVSTSVAETTFERLLSLRDEESVRDVLAPL